jgi:hypothetical protein
MAAVYFTSGALGLARWFSLTSMPLPPLPNNPSIDGMLISEQAATDITINPRKICCKNRFINVYPGSQGGKYSKAPCPGKAA